MLEIKVVKADRWEVLMLFTGIMDWWVMEESRGFSLSWRGTITGLVLSLSLSVVISLIWVSSSAWFSPHRIWEIMDNVCSSFSLTSNVHVARVWWETVPHLFMCFVLKSCDYFNYYFFTKSCFFFPSVFCSRKIDSGKFHAGVSFHPGERDNENHQTHTRRSDNENDIIIKMSRICSETAQLLSLPLS